MSVSPKNTHWSLPNLHWEGAYRAGINLIHFWYSLPEEGGQAQFKVVHTFSNPYVDSNFLTINIYTGLRFGQFVEGHFIISFWAHQTNHIKNSGICSNSSDQVWDSLVLNIAGN